MAQVLKFKGIVFDDITDHDNGLKMWSQICKCCTEKHNIDTKYLEEDAGNGICGVEGCENEADHYIDFEDNEVKITEDVLKCQICGELIENRLKLLKQHIETHIGNVEEESEIENQDFDEWLLSYFDSVD